MTSLPLAVGQTIELNDRRKAIIRFLGPTGFAPGEWIGVELDEPTGKNDGSVKGDRYFDCETNYGMFLREAGVGKILDQAKPVNKAVSNEAATGRPRPASLSLGAGKMPGMEARKRESTMMPSGLRSPTKSPTKQLGLASATPTRTGTPPTAANRRPVSTAASTTKPRTSLGSTSSSSRRTSTVPATPTSTTANRTLSRPGAGNQTGASRGIARTTTAPARQSLAPPRVPSNSSRFSSAPSNASEDRDSQGTHHSPLLSPSNEDVDSIAGAPAEEAQEDEKDTTAHAMAPPRPTSMRPPPRRAASPPPSQRTTRNNTVPTREVEDLQAKMRILERKRLEDRERLKKMTEIEQERDKYATVMQKLQTKLQNQSQELAELRKLLAESETSLLDIENIQAEHDSIVEMATLDREMAEETAEVLKSEVEALRSKNEEMALELDILREENQELGREMNPEERTSQGWMQMERSNERLREALIRLRDVTQEQEAELKDQIESLEEEVKDSTTVKNDYEETREKLLATEADVEDLRQQLEAALGAEDMIEELTDRNMTLQEQLEELSATIEDLESLKELNDELEVNHVEAEKQMQEEIDFKDSIVNENLRRSAQQQQTIEDCEYTISRFRDLVTNLQSDLEDMRASQQITGKEAEDLSSRSRAVMDLNMKLQISASKTQVKTIDLELRRLDAEEASEHLAIVKLFLPDAFLAERDSILALLRFKRIGFKANLLHGFVKERVNSHGTNPADGDVFAACSVLDRLTWISAMGQRFVNSITSCSVQDFAKYEGALYELEPVERALNNYIEALKRQDLNESKVDGELQRSMAVMSHLASLHIRESSSAFTDDVLMQTSLIQSHLETSASAFSLCRSFVQANVADLDNDDDDEDSESNEPSLIDKLDAFIAHTRGAKVIAVKTHRAVSDLQSRSLALEPSTLSVFTNAEQAASKLAAFTRHAGDTLQTLFGEEGREDPFTVSEVNLALSRLSTSVFKLATPESSTMATVANHLRALTEQLTDMGKLPADLENTTEFERLPAPWVTRSAEIRTTKLTSVDTEAEVVRLTEIVRERSVLVRTKEQELEEQGVRIEMLEARMAEAQKRSAQLGDLEASLHTFKQTEKELHDQVSEAQKDVKRIRQERDDLRQQVAEYQAVSTDTDAPNVEYGGGASRVDLDRAKAQEKNLTAAIRYLQTQAAPASTTADLDWLEEPLFTKPTPQQRQLSLLEAETKSAMSELLNVVIKSKPVSIANKSANSRLAWRPAQETVAWATQRRREEWETWRDWQDDLLRRVNGVEKTAHHFGTSAKKHDEDYAAPGRVVIVGEA